MRSLNVAATGMQAMQMNVDTISHNLANMTTTGYKAQRIQFEDLIYQDLQRAGSSSGDSSTLIPTGIQLGLGVKTGAVYRDQTQGSLQQTENSLDLAINGNGFFSVQLPDGTTAYTRDGTLQLSDQGTIVTSDGYPIQPSITIPANTQSVSIGKDGEVQATIQGQATPSTLGTIQLTNFVNQPGMKSIGGNLYQETAASGAPTTGNPGIDGYGSIMQGYLEQSNVNSVSEVTNLVVAQRAYEMNSKVITASDQMMQSLTQAAT